jgi:hypothetical protein
MYSYSENVVTIALTFSIPYKGNNVISQQKVPLGGRGINRSITTRSFFLYIARAKQCDTDIR